MSTRHTARELDDRHDIAQLLEATCTPNALISLLDVLRVQFADVEISAQKVHKHQILAQLYRHAELHKKNARLLTNILSVAWMLNFDATSYSNTVSIFFSLLVDLVADGGIAPLSGHLYALVLRVLTVAVEIDEDSADLIFCSQLDDVVLASSSRQDPSISKLKATFAFALAARYSAMQPWDGDRADPRLFIRTTLIRFLWGRLHESDAPRALRLLNALTRNVGREHVLKWIPYHTDVVLTKYWTELNTVRDFFLLTDAKHGTKKRRLRSTNTNSPGVPIFCAVCLSDVPRATELPCAHAFCNDCLRSHIYECIVGDEEGCCIGCAGSRHPICPLCRAPLGAAVWCSI